MKSPFLGSLALVLVVSIPLSTLAQTPNVVPVINNGKHGGGTFIGNAGNYNMVAQDNTSTMNKIIDNAQLNQKADKDYLLSIVAKINQDLKGIIDIGNQYNALSQKSQFEAAVTIGDFTSLVRKAKVAFQNFDAELATESTVSVESLPSYDKAQSGTMSATITRQGYINLQPLMAKAKDQRDKVYADFANLEFPRIVAPTGQQVKLLNPADINFPKFDRPIQIMTADQIQDLVNQMQEWLLPARQTRQVLNNYNDRLVTKFNDFVRNYGTTQWFRGMSDNDQKAFTEIYNDLSDALHRKSYLRKKTGRRMGALQSSRDTFPKMPAHLEDFFSQPMLAKGLTSFNRQAAFEDSDINNDFETIRNFVEFYDKKEMPVFAKSEQINSSKKGLDFSAEASLLSRFNSAITYISGQRPVAHAMGTLMRMVLGDVREEKFLLEGNRDALASYHNARYRATKEDADNENKWICQNDWSISAQTFNGVCPPLGVKVPPRKTPGISGNSIVELFSAYLNQMDVEKARQSTADNLQAQIEAANTANMTPQDVQDEQNVFN